MDVIRDIRTNYKDFLAHLFIDFLLLWIQFVDRIHRWRNGAGAALANTGKESNAVSKDMSRQRVEDSKRKANEWTEDGRERDSKQHETTELKEVDDQLGKTEDTRWLRNERHSSNYTESLEEVDSSILESTRDLQRQISALSDYYSDDEDLANSWTNAKRDESIVESLAIVENLDRGSAEFRDASLTYESFCEGLDKLRDNFKTFLEKWKKRNEESARDLRGVVSVEVQRRRSDGWNRYAENTSDWRDSDYSSVLNGSMEGSTSRLNESLRERKSSLKQHGQMLETHEQLTQRRNTLNGWMTREYNDTKKLLTLMDKTKIQLRAKVNDEELKSLSESCDALYEQQPQLRDNFKRFTREMVVRKNDVQDGVGIFKTAAEGLSSCLNDESKRLKVWSEKKATKFNQIEQMANQLKRQFDERKTVVTEMECNSYVTKLTDWLRLHEASSSQFLEEWNAMSRQAKGILKQKYLDLNKHEERCFEWKEFSEVDELREEYERHLEAFKEYVPRICEINERRSPGVTGIFGRKPENTEFNKFYQNYKRKMKAIGEDYSNLENSRMHCCQEIENYRELYDVLLGLTEKQRQVDDVLRKEDSMTRTTQEKLKEFRESIHLHLISIQGNRRADEKRQIIEVLKKIEKHLSKSNQQVEMFANSLAATRSVIEEIEKAQVLRRHFEKLESFAADWEKYKCYEKIFYLITQIENFQVIENPLRQNFEAHEERVSFLEKRLPKIVELHEGNYSSYLQTWCTYSLEYNEGEMEPFSFDEMSKQNETWSSDCEKIHRVLENLKRELAGRLQQLQRVDEDLTLLGAQGYGLPVFESTNSFTERFGVQFRQAEDACRNFRQALTDFQPVYGKYFELKTGHHRVMETLAKERYSADKLTEKLENCEGLLTGHRDHLERRRIEIKVKELLAFMEEVLFVKAKESEQQVNSLEVESKLLIHNFLDLSGQRYSEITQLKIPNVREFLISLDDCEQSLNSSEEKLSKCEITLIKEEKTVHEYWNSVQLLTTFLTEASDKAKVLEPQLEEGDKLLQICQRFIESYANQEKTFDAHLSDAKRRLAAFNDAFKSTENEANDLDKLFGEYCSKFDSDTSGDSFRAESVARLSEMFTAIDDYRKLLHQAEHVIKAIENDARKRLEEGKRDRMGIQQKLAVYSKDISDCREILKRCKSLFCVIRDKRVEREGQADAFKKRLQDENYEEHYKMYERNPIENEQIFDCSKCLKKTKPREGIILRECLHQFCKKCIETHIRHSKTAEVACPSLKDQTPCFGIILDKEIQAFGADVNMLCAERSLSEYKDQNRFVLTCGSCSGLIVDDGQPRCQKPFFSCPYCEKKNCRKCRVVHEGGETCKDYELTLPYRKIVESLKCTLCLENEIQVAFVPCGHLVCCENCSKKLREPLVCPHCKTPIGRSLKIYLPTGDIKSEDDRKTSQRK